MVGPSKNAKRKRPVISREGEAQLNRCRLGAALRLFCRLRLWRLVARHTRHHNPASGVKAKIGKDFFGESGGMIVIGR